MTTQTFGSGDLVRFQAYTREAAEVDHKTGTVLGRCQDIPLVGEWVDIAFGGAIRRGVPTGRLELVRRATKDDHRFIEVEDIEAFDRERGYGGNR